MRPKKCLVCARSRGGIPCCGRGGEALQPVIQRKFFGGLAEKVGHIMAKGAVEDVVGATAKHYGYKRGGAVKSVF